MYYIDLLCVLYVILIIKVNFHFTSCVLFSERIVSGLVKIPTTYRIYTTKKVFK